MLFTKEDRIIIRHFQLEKLYSAWKLLCGFPSKHWTRCCLDKLLRKIDQTHSIDQKKGSGGPKSVRTVENIETVEGKRFEYLL